MAACAKEGIEDLDGLPNYWPAGILRDDPLDPLFRYWYSQQLCAMGEPPLTQPAAGNMRLRFLLLPSFEPGIAVRVEHALGETQLVAVELNGAGGYEPGTVARRTAVPLSPEEFAALLETITKTDFWRLPTSEDDLGIVDGSRWIVEISENDRYHVVDRQLGGELEILGRHLIRLAQWQPQPYY